jgi:hypothetical protein
MKKHLVSFLKSPVGYAFNFLAHLPLVGSLGLIASGCEVFCLRDGVQDEVWF